MKQKKKNPKKTKAKHYYYYFTVIFIFNKVYELFKNSILLSLKEAKINVCRHFKILYVAIKNTLQIH